MDRFQPEIINVIDEVGNRKNYAAKNCVICDYHFSDYETCFLL